MYQSNNCENGLYAQGHAARYMKRFLSPSSQDRTPLPTKQVTIMIDHDILYNDGNKNITMVQWSQKYNYNEMVHNKSVTMQQPQKANAKSTF